jgi:hypothetical protein
MGFPTEAFAGVMTSGEVAHVYLRDRPTPWWQALGRRCLHLTWGVRSSISLEGLDLQAGPLYMHAVHAAVHALWRSCKKVH